MARLLSTLVLGVALSACDGDVTLVGGGGAGAGGSPGSGGDSASAGAAPLGGEGGQGGEASELPVCPADGECIEEVNCLVTDGTSGGCRNIQCDLPSPCDTVEFVGSGGFGHDPPFTVETPEALACLFAALRDGTVGSYSWLSTDIEETPWGYTHVLYVHPGRQGLGYRDGSVDLGVTRHTLGPAALEESSYFEDCAAVASADAAWECLSSWSSGCDQ